MIDGTKIKKRRLEMGYSRIEFSKVSGIPIRTLEDWESQRRRPSKYDHIMILLKLLECDLSSLETLNE